jgi:hypothetical protein
MSRYTEYGHTATALLDLAALKDWVAGGPHVASEVLFTLGRKPPSRYTSRSLV